MFGVFVCCLVVIVLFSCLRVGVPGVCRACCVLSHVMLHGVAPTPRGGMRYVHGKGHGEWFVRVWCGCRGRGVNVKSVSWCGR
jgi:hypothetical protein